MAEPHIQKTSPDAPLGPVALARLHFKDILARHSQGESLQEIAESLDPGLTGAQLRRAIADDNEMTKSFNAIVELRAHWMIEECGRLAGMAAKAGDVAGMKVAIDSYMKLAGKIAPKLYGDKSTLELVGAGGGPIQTKVAMDPSDAYKAMLGQK